MTVSELTYFREDASYRTERNKVIAEWYDEGATIVDLAAEFELNQNYIRQIIREQRPEIVQQWREERQVAKMKRDQQIKMQYKVGKTAAELSEAHDLTLSTIHRVLREQGIDLIDERAIKLRERNRVIKQYFEKGMTIAEIEEEVGLVEKIIRDILKGQGVDLRKWGWERRKAKREARLRQIVVRYDAGATIEDLAEEFNLTGNTIRKMLKTEGRGAPKVSLSPNHDRDQVIRARFEGGATVQELTQEFNLSDGWIYQILKKGKKSARTRKRQHYKGRNLRIVVRYDEGLALRELCDEFELSEGRIRNILEWHGRKLRERWAGHYLQRNQDIGERFDQGETVKALAAAYQLAEITIEEILRKQQKKIFWGMKREIAEAYVLSLGGNVTMRSLI